MLFNVNNIFHVRNLLITEFFVYVAIVAISVVGFESDMFWVGKFADDTDLAFIWQAVMEIITVCFVPLALKMFTVKKIKASLEKEMGGKPLAGWGSLRLAMLGLPMLANTLLYYKSMAIAFAYMALICLVSMVFVYPGDERIVAECKLDPDED